VTCMVVRRVQTKTLVQFNTDPALVVVDFPINILLSLMGYIPIFYVKFLSYHIPDRPTTELE
jgi:hypothetical protein